MVGSLRITGGNALPTYLRVRTSTMYPITAMLATAITPATSMGSSPDSFPL